MKPSLLQRSPLFAGLRGPALAEIADALATETWSRKRQIVGPSQTAKRFRIIVRGRVKITRCNSHEGRELTLWLLGPGDGFDIVSLLDGEPHAISAWALDDVTILSAPAGLFRGWLERFDPLRLAFHRYAAGKLRELSELASDLALHDTSARLAHLLLRHIDTSGRSDRPHIDPMLDLPREELASMIGTVRVVVSRLISDMARDGVLSVHNGALRIESLKRLLRRADASSRSSPHRAGSRKSQTLVCARNDARNDAPGVTQVTPWTSEVSLK